VLVRYGRARVEEILPAQALELAAAALLRLGEAPEPEDAGDRERLLAMLESEAGAAGEPDPRGLAEAVLRKLQTEGWLEREPGRGETRLLLHPGFLEMVSLKALRSLRPPRSRTGAGHWPRPGRTGPHEPHGTARPWRWGEPLALDATETLKELVFRGELTAAGLRVREGEGGNRAAVALLLDCSHSMVLYGVDRFGPAKRLALALHRWLGGQGDRLEVICFHDVAERVAPGRIPFLRAQPSHTNIQAALATARAWLRRQGEMERRVLLVTDGRPTAMSLGGGGLYKNAWGRDPRIERATLAAAARLRREGAELDIYLLEDDPLVEEAARELARAARGRLLPVDPAQLGRRVLADLSAGRR